MSCPQGPPRGGRERGDFKIKVSPCLSIEIHSGSQPFPKIIHRLSPAGGMKLLALVGGCDFLRIVCPAAQSIFKILQIVCKNE